MVIGSPSGSVSLGVTTSIVIGVSTLVSNISSSAFGGLLIPAVSLTEIDEPDGSCAVKVATLSPEQGCSISTSIVTIIRSPGRILPLVPSKTSLNPSPVYAVLKFGVSVAVDRTKAGVPTFTIFPGHNTVKSSTICGLKRSTGDVISFSISI